MSLMAFSLVCINNIGQYQRCSDFFMVYTRDGSRGGGGGGGKLHKEGKMLHTCARKWRILLPVTPTPPFPKSCIRPCILNHMYISEIPDWFHSQTSIIIIQTTHVNDSIYEMNKGPVFLDGNDKAISNYLSIISV